MNVKFTTLIILLLGKGYLTAQVTIVNPEVVKSKSFKASEIKRADIQMQTIEVEKSVALVVFGEFIITGYHILGTDIPSDEIRMKLVGSDVWITEVEIQGSVIGNDSIAIFESERMSRSDFIYRNFGRNVRVQEPDIPEYMTVYKTGNEHCYGIAVISDGIAIPYKGLLLILVRK